MAVPAIMETVTHEDALRPLDRPWTVDDLDELPDDGRRFEIVDGSLHVTPPPDYLHAQVASRLQWPMHPALPRTWRSSWVQGSTVARNSPVTWSRT